MKSLIRKTILFIALTCACQLVLYSQPDTLNGADLCLNNILETKVLRKGIYRSFEDFLNNSPCILINISTFKIDTAGTYHLETNNGFIDLIDNTDKTKRRIPQPVWGFCDGKKVYYVDQFLDYYEFHIIGHFCACSYISTGYGGIGNNISFTGRSVESTTNSSREYAVDILTGETIILNARSMKTRVLVEDPELLQEYTKDKLKNVMSLQYIERYNERHPVKL
jgi:hypothetical protein